MQLGEEPLIQNKGNKENNCIALLLSESLDKHYQPFSSNLPPRLPPSKDVSVENVKEKKREVISSSFLIPS